MKILWHRVFAFVLAVVALGFALRHRHALARLLETPQYIGPGHSPDEMTLGLITLGLLGVTLVAVVRLLTRK